MKRYPVAKDQIDNLGLGVLAPTLAIGSVGLLIAPQVSRHVLEFSLERVTSLQLQVRGRSLTVVAYAPNSIAEHLAFLEEYWKVLE